jgi:hypothetical protein
VSARHPLELPALYVHGQPLLRDVVFRSPLAEGDVELVQCSICEVQIDGGEWRDLLPSQFRARFLQPTNATWNVRLLHERPIDGSRAQVTYRVRFRVPNAEVLSKVDEHFVRTLVLEKVAHSDLERFRASERFGEAATLDAPEREYATALGDYALGVVLKERHRLAQAQVDFSEFAFKMRSAHETLRSFHRTVALAVCACIRFNLNNFDNDGAAIPTDLEPAFTFFRGITDASANAPLSCSNPRSPRAASHQVCPIDQVSHLLIAACANLDSGRISVDDLECLRHLSRDVISVSEYDDLKIHAICAEGYLRLARADDAIPHLNALQFDPALGEWARRRREETTSYGR